MCCQAPLTCVVHESRPCARPGQVNYLGHWLLAHMLLGQQRSRGRQQRAGHRQSRHAPVHMATASSRTAEEGSEGTRVIFLSSTTHRAGRLDWADLQLRRAGVYSGFRGYANSKLAALLAAREFQRRLDRCAATTWRALHGCSHAHAVILRQAVYTQRVSKHSDAIAVHICRNVGQRGDVAVAVHPGLVNTQLARDWITGADVWGRSLQPVLAPVMRALAPWLLIPPNRAVDTLLFAASAPAHQVSVLLCSIPLNRALGSWAGMHVVVKG